MARRHREALLIQEGACNPSGIAFAIVAACDEIRSLPSHTGTKQITDDPAIRLMVHQLAFLCHVHEIDHGTDEVTNSDIYNELCQSCRNAIRGNVPDVA